MLEGAIEFIGVIARFTGRMVTEILIEFLCKGVGFLICRIFNRNVDPDGLIAFVTGFVFWILVSVFAFAIYDYFLLSEAAKHCLDSGGIFTPCNDIYAVG